MPLSLLFALALAAEAPCAAVDADLPASLAGWRDPLAAEMLTPGRAARLTLRPVAEAGFIVPPGRAAAAGTYGGVVRFVVERPGTYRIALQRTGWIDVVGSGRAIASTAHGHGPACSSIRKIVDFDLAAGEYALQLSGLDQADAVAMVVGK
jgi:hypothetical protein